MKKIISLLVISLSVVGVDLFAQAKDFTTTGSAVRVKKIAFVNVNVYAITHQMKDVPATRSAQEMINAETDKRFILKMKRNVDSAKIVTAINDAYALNGYSNKANQDTFSSVLTGDLKENDTITISYNAATKSVTCNYSGKTSTVTGSDFMKATWSIWFGKIDQPSLTQALVGN
ncbi:MAG TPA: chalcone isomerase family protein [Leptospiraceae bacterium]|nr:chalcone isomerase family protein [Leptospiraceae bacterium]HMW06019.1 chalcone isomerase family protein [Leptospiraceae bacterium]HMX32783.1 chalcone isomerase family protein [Leptospiraceae bacterium]HMY31439.1 chalcone isomerase family protein [Leptospiraceae bacterium]HMZ66561.1 chalcone isomerase family protein [Leptospiraceae bacterium]